MKELWVSVPGIGHSDIRGFGFLLTYRSMVRRERYRLLSWVTILCHHSYVVDHSNLEKPKLLQDAFRFFNMAALQPLITRYRSGLGMSRPEPRQRCEAALTLPGHCDQLQLGADAKDSLKSRMRENRKYGSEEGRRQQCRPSTQRNGVVHAVHGDTVASWNKGIPSPSAY